MADGYMVCGYCTQANANHRRGLTLATLCDMVLGEGTADRSDDALIRAVGELIRSKAPKTINFGFTIECPNCSALVECNHLEHEVLFTGTEFGECPKCHCLLKMDLYSMSNEPQTPTLENHE